MSLPDHIAAQNRKARHDYTILQTLEAGLVLVGTEVKSLRAGKGNINEAYAGLNSDGGIWLYNAYIPEYQTRMPFPHETRRPRKLLVHRRELNKLSGAIAKEGMTLVPLDIHFNHRGIAKVLLGLAKGRKTHDRREAIKQRDWDREKARVLRNRQGD